MKRFAVSAVYTAAAFLAALVVVVVIVRSSDVEAQAKFFYYQAIYFVLTTVISQFLTLSTFRNMPARRAGIIADGLALVIVILFLQLPASFSFTAIETLCYAAATVLLYRGSALTILVQFFSFNSPRWIWVPLLAMILRAGLAMATAAYGPAVMFLANGIATFALPFAILSLGLLRRDREEGPKAAGASGGSTSLFFFFVMGSMTFLWERVLYAMQDNTESLLVTGYVMTVVLAPLSALFATLYRANAREIFSGSEGHDRSRLVLRTGGPFGLASVGYLLVVAALWPTVMDLLGAKILPPVWLPLVLGAAIILDRLANLLVFLDKTDRSYARAATAKGIIIAVSAGGAALAGLALPQSNYLVFLWIALAYFAAIAIRRH